MLQNKVFPDLYILYFPPKFIFSKKWTVEERETNAEQVMTHESPSLFHLLVSVANFDEPSVILIIRKINREIELKGMM